jgi:hypothetical protein
MPFFRAFDIDLPRALREQLVEAFSQLETGALNPANVNQVPVQRGVYQLYFDEQLVYVGKADRLRTRLTKHMRKIQGRTNLEISQMSFKCLYMSANWSTLAPESQLIALYKSQGTAFWNGNGFGPNDPGAGREDRNKPPAYFDQQYPIRENWPCDFIVAGDWAVVNLLRSMKRDLPFLLRFQKTSPDYANVSIEVPSTGMPASELLRMAATSLPQGWQATRFPSHMILYKRIREFQFGTVIYPEIGPLD